MIEQPTQRRTWWQTQCVYCQRRLERPRARTRVAATWDHEHPKSLGGTVKVPCCKQCNNLKTNMTMAEWSVFMELHPKWWNDSRFSLGGVSLPMRVEVVRIARERAGSQRRENPLGSVPLSAQEE